TGAEAARRESDEEAGINISKTKGVLVGTRNLNRPYDVRVAFNDELEEKYGVKKGDIFMVSTQAVRFDKSNLPDTGLIAGDDAEPGSARCVDFRTLRKDSVGIPDHYDMIVAAIPEYFSPKPATPLRTPKPR